MIDLADLQLCSGVLAASIERSKQKWLNEGVFERYWTKPSKKKNLAEVQNPAKESMTKLGTCSMIIEPHVFEITLYTVKELNYTFMPRASQDAPAPQRTPIVSSHGQQYAGYPQPHTSLPPAHQISQSSPGIVLPPFREGFAHFDPQVTTHNPSPHNRPALAVPAQAPKISRENKEEVEQQHEQSPSSPDPVIQMLAARAATDHELKSLMRVVASGKATQTQLRVFQDHIDELNNIIQSQKKDEQKKSTIQPQEPPNELPGKPDAVPIHPVQSFNETPSAQSGPLTGYHPRPIKAEPLSQYYSQPIPPPKPRAPVPYRQDVTAIVFDFSGGTGDRYLFPKNSIIEYLPGNTQLLASFLITRKGSMTVKGTYKPNLEYYQPITIRLSSHSPRILEPFTRVLPPQEAVRKYMTDVMSKMQRAETAYLATRLPRTTDALSADHGTAKKQPEKEKLKTFYSPPNSLMPLFEQAT